MKLSKTITAAQVRSLNIQEADVLGLDYQWAEENQGFDHYLTVNGHRAAAFDNPSKSRKSLDKIKNMGLGFGWKAPMLTDEEQGLIEAGKRGENPFAFSMLCADPTQNVSLAK